MLSMNTTTKTGLALATAALASLSFAGPGQVKGLDAIRELKQSGFTENKGQWDARALFLQSSPGKDVWVTRNGFTIDLYRLEMNQSSAKADSVEGADASKPASIGLGDMRRVGHVVRINYVGAGKSATSEGTGALPTVIDYLKPRGDQHWFRTKAYKEAYVNNLYPGIHLRNYTDGGAFRFDLLVMPGANPGQVRMDVQGADSLRVDDKGSLVITTTVGMVQQTLPFVYQQVGSERVRVDASYVVNGGQVSFRLGEFNKDLPLVIDPLVYGSYVGADAMSPFQPASDEVRDGAADSFGNLYMTGTTNAVNFPVLNGPYGLQLRGGLDAFFARMDGDAYALDYAAYIGGTSGEEGRSLAFSEPTGIVWLGGLTDSLDFPGAPTRSANPDLPVVWWFSRFNVAPGSLAITPVFSRYYVNAGPALDAWQGMATNSQGVLFIGGTGLDLAANPAPSFRTVPFASFLPGSQPGGADGFVQRVNIDGTLSSARRVGGPNTDILSGIAVSPAGVVGVSGHFTSNRVSQDTQNLAPGDVAVFPTTPGVYRNGQISRNGDSFVVTFNNMLQTTISALVGGASAETSAGIAFDRRNDIYLLGLTRSFDYPRTRGVYDEVFSNNAQFGEGALTKLSANGSEVIYSTGLRYNESVLPKSIKVDYRGVAVIGGDVTHRYPGGTPPQQTIPGSIVTTADAVDPTYDGGNESVNPPNQPTGDTAFASSQEGYVQFVNASGTDVLYASYIGQIQNDFVNAVLVDNTGSAWILGHTIANPNPQGNIRGQLGVGPHITTNAFKVGPDGYDGFVIKLRVGLPILSSLNLSRASIAGGLGASTVATFSLRQPAPAGGVVINCTLTDPSVTSFSATGGVGATTVTIPAGQTTGTVTIFSSPVTVISNSDLRVSLDNDFLLTRISVNPWLQELVVSPSSIVGGNSVTLSARLFENAPADISVTVQSSNSAVVNLATNNAVVVPTGANIGTLTVPTAGVDATRQVTITGSLLRADRASVLTVNRANLTSVVFSPNRVVAGQGGTITLTMDGRAGPTARTIRLNRTAGSNLRVNGRDLPLNVTLFAQQSSITLPFSTNAAPAPQTVVVEGVEGTRVVSATLGIEEPYGVTVTITPNDVTGGEANPAVTVSVDRPAPAGGLRLDLVSSHPTIATLNRDFVLIPAGQRNGDPATPITLTTSRVGADTVVSVRAQFSPTVFGVGSAIVRAPSLIGLDISPTTVTGPATATGTVTLAQEAPAGGLIITLSSDNTAAATVPARVTVPEGATTANFIISARSVASDTSATITARGSSSVRTALLNVLSVGADSVTFTPTRVKGGVGATGRVTLSVAAPAGGVLVSLTSDTPGVAAPTVTQITIPAGQRTGTFQVRTSRVSRQINVGITATVVSSGKSARGFLGVDP